MTHSDDPRILPGEQPGRPASEQRPYDPDRLRRTAPKPPRPTPGIVQPVFVTVGFLLIGIRPSAPWYVIILEILAAFIFGFGTWYYGKARWHTGAADALEWSTQLMHHIEEHR